MPPQSADEYNDTEMVSQGLEQGVVKRHRSFRHHRHSTSFEHDASSMSSLAAEEPLVDKKKRNAFSLLDRRGNVVRQLLSSRARLFAIMLILLMTLLLPIYTFHAARLVSPSSSSEPQQESSSASSPWSNLSSTTGRRASSNNNLLRRSRTRKTEPRSLYGGHYRAVEYAFETNTATRAVFNQTSSSSFPRGDDVKRKKHTFEFLAHHKVLPPPPLYRVIEEPLITHDQILALADSKDYYDQGWADLDETERCKAQFAWQKGIIATCNLHHELDMTVFNNRNHYHNNNNNNNIQQEVYHSGRRQNLTMEDEESLRLLASGHRRDIWVFDAPATATAQSSISGHNVSNSSASHNHNSNNNKLVIKTQRWRWEFDMHNAERHRQDAIAMERLTSSPFILNAYSSCANSAITEYAQGGTMEEAVTPNEERNRSRPQQQQQQQKQGRQRNSSKDDKLELLRMAFQAAKGLEALHTLGRGGPFGTRTQEPEEVYDDAAADADSTQQQQHVPPFGPTIAHTDISADQFVRVGDVWKLNDFNRGPFILGDFEKGKTCPYIIDFSGGNYRSPEEYRGVPLTAQIDVYSLGNVFYQLLTGHEPFEDGSSSLDSDETEEVQKRVIRGERPTLPQDIAASDNVVDQVLQKAMNMAFIGDPKKRATASEIASLLQEALQQVDPGRLEQWGVAAA